jgi:hypothetical protein
MVYVQVWFSTLFIITFCCLKSLIQYMTHSATARHPIYFIEGEQWFIIVTSDGAKDRKDI